MRAITRRDPFEMPAISSLINHVFSEPFFAPVPAMNGTETAPLPVDVSEDDTNVYVRASLPGYDKERISLEINDNVLTLRAEHAEEKEEKSEKFYRRERRFGSVSRSITLPTEVRENDATAELKDGVLTITIPRVAEKMPKKISIN